MRCGEGMGSMSVLHFRKVLSALPAPLEVAGIRVRTMRLPDDAEAWLELRQRAVAWLKPTARAWTEADFRAEMSGKAWWRDEWTWLAVAEEANETAGELRL